MDHVYELEPMTEVLSEETLVHGRFAVAGPRDPDQEGLRYSNGEDTFCSFAGLATYTIRDVTCDVCWKVVAERMKTLSQERSRITRNLNQAAGGLG